MAGHHSWNKLMKRMPAARRRRIERGARAQLEEMLLSELRRVAGLTQEELAGTLGVRQPTVSHLESQDDMQISTLRRIVEALGGDLEIIAALPSGRVTLSQFAPARRRARSA